MISRRGFLGAMASAPLALQAGKAQRQQKAAAKFRPGDLVLWCPGDKNYGWKFPCFVSRKGSKADTKFWREPTYYVVSDTSGHTSPESSLHPCTEEEAVDCMVSQWGKSEAVARAEIERARKLVRDLIRTRRQNRREEGTEGRD